MEEYLEKLLSQIRCKKARPYVENEIKSHMEEQIADNIRAGMTKEEAEKAAVADMGDPVEAGVSLDKVHRPQVAWSVVAIVVVLSIAGIFIQQSILKNISIYEMTSNQMLDIGKRTGFLSSVLLGISVMFLLYFIDYTVIARYSKIIGAVIIGIAVLTVFGGTNVNGRNCYLYVGGLNIPTTTVMMFYVPIYGAILYKYRGGGKAALLKAIFWMVVPAVCVLKFPSLIVAATLFVSMLVQLTIAVTKGWFHVPVRRTVALMWTTALLLPVLMLALGGLAEYQMARIRGFLSITEDGFYMTSLLRSFCKDVPLFGSSGKDLVGSLPNFNRDYIFSYVLNSYGTIAGVLLVAALASLIFFIFSSSIRQKNELGLSMGCGCGMIFLINTVINLLGCLGIVPPTTSFLPFFSSGGSNLVLSYALIGIILSIYRYKNVYPAHVQTKWFQKNIKIEM